MFCLDTFTPHHTFYCCSVWCICNGTSGYGKTVFLFLHIFQKQLFVDVVILLYIVILHITFVCILHYMHRFYRFCNHPSIYVFDLLSTKHSLLSTPCGVLQASNKFSPLVTLFCNSLMVNSSRGCCWSLPCCDKETSSSLGHTSAAVSLTNAAVRLGFTALP